MIKYFFEAAEGNSGTMEAENHLKNCAMEAESISKHGASSKSLMSRVSVFNVAFLALFVVALFVVGCDDDGDDDNAKVDANVPVTSVTVTSTGNVNQITTQGGTLQMLADVQPDNATDKSVTWSISPPTGVATISANGLLTAVSNGVVKVRATANDGSNLFGERDITIAAAGGSSQNPQPFTITAVVQNGSAHNNLISKVAAYVWVEEEGVVDEYGDPKWEKIELASGNYANGGFTMTLPETLDDKFLENILDSEFGDMGTANPTNAKICAIHKSEFEAYSSNGTNVGYFFHGSYYDPEIWALYVYADREVSVTADESDFLMTMSLKKGWNVVYVWYDDDDNHFISTTMPSIFQGMLWKFYGE